MRGQHWGERLLDLLPQRGSGPRALRQMLKAGANIQQITDSSGILHCELFETVTEFKPFILVL